MTANSLGTLRAPDGGELSAVRYRVRRGTIALPRTTPVLEVDVELVELHASPEQLPWFEAREWLQPETPVLRTADGRELLLAFVEVNRRALTVLTRVAM